MVETDAYEEKMEEDSDDEELDVSKRRDNLTNIVKNLFSGFGNFHGRKGRLNNSIHSMMDCSISLKIHKHRSSHALVGAYLDINNQQKKNSTGDVSTKKFDNAESDDLEEVDDSFSIGDIVDGAIRDRKINDRLHLIFEKFDKDNDHSLSESEFMDWLAKFDSSLTDSEKKIEFQQADYNRSGAVDYKEFVSYLQNSGFDRQINIPPSNRDDRGLIQIEASRERYFGETLRKYNAGENDDKDMDFVLAERQHLIQELYETRIASMQRYVAMCVLFYKISKRVERFFAKISFGWWAYRMDRTHSIVRIATTASPVR